MIDGETLRNNITRDEYIVCDWDSVIQQIDVYWMVKVLQNRELYEPYFDFNKITRDGRIDPSIILERDIYYLEPWMKRDNIEIPKELNEHFVNLYIKDDDFYNNCPFLTMANGLKELSKMKFVKEIIFLSSAPLGHERDDRKEIQLKKFFGNNEKMSIKIIAGHKKKSEYINENIPYYTMFIDDRSDILRDVIDNTESSNKTFMFPVYNYNKEIGNDKEYIKKSIYDKGSVLKAYKNEVI